MTSNHAILFPGQGAQCPGMGASLFDIYPKLLADAEEIAEFSIRDFFLNSPADRFSNTLYVQPALYTVNALYYRRYIDQCGALPRFLAGHSLGEFNALQAAGVFDFATGLLLVKKRALLMSESLGGGMAAVLGLNAEEVIQVIEENNLFDLTIANINSDLQMVISGPIESIKQAEEVFYDNYAIKYVVLRVSGAFHSTMLNSAAIKFSEYIQSFSFLPPQIPVIANRTACPYTLSSIIQNLSEHINQPVMWRQSVIYMRAQGVDRFIEMGDSSLLRDMVKNIV
ncbi:ACP S-malonyltransferase [Yersinia pekkanenii]|uniref:Malonyl CoA-acyl carrier protein transacylase n=1 Tax=Yersinia pekkanenii TaxID=1288385 RepID=A0A0T9NI22_9GAMM|nr:ACP S-malonyltransferase [Yersinia pekkanenii]CNH10808.1 putative acyl transferase [Yersinia pekkanenii]CRY64792.1 putative acyl transferase [Yersinia pekkanenii]